MQQTHANRQYHTHTYIIKNKYKCTVNDNYSWKMQGRIQGAHTPPLKLEKIRFFWHKIVIFHTKCPKNFHASLRSVQFFYVHLSNLKSWICSWNVQTGWLWLYGSWIYNYLCNQCLHYKPNHKPKNIQPEIKICKTIILTFYYF